jgi:O-acetyl-ADP-ribose deacetylase (regulator of RNase III)
MEGLRIMNIEYRKGDLLEAARKGKVSAIAQSCNCFCTMKSGIAPQIAKHYPEAEEVDKLTERGDKKKLGGLTYVVRDKQPYMVFNLYTQYGYGKTGMHVDYDALDKSLYTMNEHIQQYNKDNPMDKIIYLGLPKISCGLAGGDWKIVSELIQRNIKNIIPVVYILVEKT